MFIYDISLSQVAKSRKAKLFASSEMQRTSAAELLVKDMHIKTIKGKKYYYESKRIGHKVTSIYIGPVAGIQAHKKLEDDIEDVSNQTDDEFYVG